MSQVMIEVNFYIVTCPQCGITFGIPNHFNNKLRESHATFYCPSGHNQYYPDKSDAEKLRDKLNQEQSKLANAQLEMMMKEKEITKLKKRAKNGTCPCCKRQFSALAKHMKSKHPDYGK